MLNEDIQMKSKTKFKQTEIGMIPEEWEVKRIGEVAEVIGGGTPSTKNPEYWDGDIAWITPKDLSAFKFRYIKRGERNITKKGLENSGAKLLPKGTVLLTTRAPVGYLAIASNPVTTNQGFRNLIPNNKTTSEFLFYLLRKNVDFLKSNAGGTTFGELSGSRLKELEFPFPPLPEQRAIAKILSDLDAKIELNQQMNKTLEAIGQAIFKHWFVDFEFPNEEGKPYKSSGGEMVYNEELGKEIPKGWRVGKIIDLCSSITNGGTPKRMECKYWGGNIAWFKTGELTDGILIDSEEHITEQGLKNSACKLWNENTILIALYASPTVGRLGLLKIKATANQACSGLNAKDEIGYPFLFYTLFFKRDEFNNVAVGAAQQNISQKIVQETKTIIPPQDIIMKFNSFAERLFDKQTELVFQNRTLSSLRDALLPKLMSGKIRVPVEVKK